MISTKNSSNVNHEKSERNKYTLKEHVDEDETFIDAIILQLPEHPDTKLTEMKDITLLKLPDAEIDFDKICRTCLATTNVKNIFDDISDGTSIRTLLVQLTSISVQEYDMMPKHICNACISELVNCYEFKKKCLQAQHNLEEIIKYSDMRRGAGWNEGETQIPFLLHNLQFNTDNKTEKQEVAQMENHSAQKTTNSEPNINDLLNESDIKKESEVTIQNEEGETNYDTDLLSSDCENDIKNKQIKRELSLDCSRCSKTFETPEELESHLREVKHRKKRRTQPCNVCGKIIPAHHISVHMRTHTKEKPYKCKICFKTFSLNCNLKRHFMLHTGEKPYICDFCGKGYIQAGSLREHICTHTGQKPLLCEICGRGFAYHANLIDHKCIYPDGSSLKNSSQILEYGHDQISNREFGQQSRLHPCSVCQKSFRNTRMLRKHMLLTHCGKHYLCNHCGKEFRHRSSFDTHLKVHTGDKPNSCSECGKSFSQAGSLKSHMLIHSGQRPFNCKICSKSFIQGSHLGSHMKTHTGERPYKCTYCSKSFALNGTLTVHIRTHTGETPYVCDVCGRGFYHSSSMKKHKSRHNKVKVLKKKI